MGMLLIKAPAVPGAEVILTEDALSFLNGLERKFVARRRELIAARADVQQRLDDGGTLDFLAETAAVRAGDWGVPPAPADLTDRRVEITGPVDRKMIINAMNSGANAFMADFEDSNTPTWANQIAGQINLRDAVRGTISFENSGKRYVLAEKTATLMVRPRGLHMEERHVLCDGQPMSASFFDFGLYLFHNAQTLLQKGTGPYFYLPKMESYREARLWSDVLSHSEDVLGLKRGAIRVTVLIETITAAFQMDEILHELKDHITGLNCGRWDYIFSFIKRFSKRPKFVLPDRDVVTMTRHFLNSYSQLLIKTCHRRGAHAMGGMAAQIPIKNDDAANESAIEKVRADKEREAGNGHDGTWVAHPGLVSIAKSMFDAVMPGPNQLNKLRQDVSVTAEDLLRVPSGHITEGGLRKNMNVGLMYLSAWLGGSGCVPIYHLMEDAATAEISRMQLWQWHRHRAKLDDGRTIDAGLVNKIFTEEAEKLHHELKGQTYFENGLEDAIALFHSMITDETPDEFLTTRAYEKILAYEQSALRG